MEDFLELFRALPSPAIVTTDASPNLKANLRSYQLEGLQWLIGMYSQNLNGILADEMGLGKTLQTIALMLELYEKHTFKGPFLVVCPLSLTDNWRQEIERFAPSLTTLVYAGDKNERQALRDKVVAHVNSLPAAQRKDPPLPFTIVLTTYEVCNSDLDFLRQFRWKYLIVDEAARLKNSESVLYQSLSSLRAKHCCLITGTPVQNNLKELESLLHFCMPKLFNDTTNFEQWFGRDPSSSKQKNLPLLHQILERFMLRRTKEQVLKDLPEKQEVYMYVRMTALQKKLYKSILLKDLSAFENGAKSRLVNVLMQLRKCVNHPYLFDGVEPEPFEPGDHLINASGKLRILDRLLKHLKAGGHRVLLFSQMTRTLDIIQDYLHYRGYAYERLDGSVRGQERFLAVKSFTTGSESFVFLLSTRAGGVGLNLTAADTVIFYDSDFNPQADLQASARVHRIGQTKRVNIIRFVCKDTVEEIILRRANKKLELSRAVMADNQEAVVEIGAPQTTEELITTLRFGMRNLMSGDETEDDEDDVDFDKLLSGTKPQPIQEEKIKDDEDKLVDEPASSSNSSSSNHESIYFFKGFDYSKLSKTVESADDAAYQQLVEQAKNPNKDAITSSPARVTRKKTILTQEQRDILEEEMNLQKQQRKEEAKARKEEKRKQLWAENGYISSSIVLNDDQLDTEASTTASSDDETEQQLEYVDGDVTQPQLNTPDEIAIIINCVDNSGRWGKGGVFAALDLLEPMVGQRYELASAMDDLKLGDVHIEPVLSHPGQLFVASVVAQERGRDGHLSPVLLPELETALAKIAIRAQELKASVHLPRIGQRSPEFNWYRTERRLQKTLVARGIRTLVYYFSRRRTGGGSLTQSFGESSSSSSPPKESREEIRAGKRKATQSFPDETNPPEDLHIGKRKAMIDDAELADGDEDGSVSGGSDTEDRRPIKPIEPIEPKRTRRDNNDDDDNELRSSLKQLDVLSGCVVWLAIPDPELRRHLIAYDAEVLRTFRSEVVTHILVPDDPVEANDAIINASLPTIPPTTKIVSVQWAVDSIKQAKKLNEQSYQLA